MFTGLVEEIGRIGSTVRRGPVADITIKANTVLEGIRAGDSISVQGACQTVVRFGKNEFTVQAVEETIQRTTLGTLRPGSLVNLERSVMVGSRLGGHFVSGHVDGTGRVVSVGGSRDNRIVSIQPPPGLSRYIAEKGSVTLDGVSLTVTFASDAEFGVSIIPHTLGATTLDLIGAGDRVNIEVDIIARYVERLLGRADSLTMERLQSLGF